MKTKTALILAVMALLVTACGIKPSEVDPPIGSDAAKFPRNYPDLGTDPAAEAAKISK